MGSCRHEKGCELFATERGGLEEEVIWTKKTGTGAGGGGGSGGGEMERERER